ncbi:MAG: hypothetical protein ACOYXO_09815 [Chloroflexota bacterium]
MDEKRLNEILETLHPAIRGQLEELFDAPHLQGLTRVEIFLAYWAVGWLSSALNGYIAIDRSRLRRVLNIAQVEDAYVTVPKLVN